MWDFTLQMYELVCSEAKEQGYVPITVEDCCSGKADPDKKNIIFRHDVDRKPKTALRMATLEYKMDIRATFYFRYLPDVFDPAIVRQIQDMHHEIGYHYEVLDKADGDLKKAIGLFEQELARMREIANVRTACMHGNPLKPWSNRDLWKTHDYRKFGIVGEPYLLIDYSKYLYLSDTGRTWSGNYSVKDIVDAPSRVEIRHTDDIIGIMKSGRYPDICLLVHPNRWSDDPVEWMNELVWQNCKNVGKAFLKRK